MAARDFLVPTDPPTLQYPFVVDFLDQILEKRWLGGPFVRFPALFTVQSRLYETGSIIGLLMRPHLVTVAQTFSAPGADQQTLVEFIRKRANTRLDLYREVMSVEPESLIYFFVLTELEEKRAPKDALLGDWKNLKIPLDAAYTVSAVTMAEGIGFGAAYPELLEAMWSKSWGSRDPAIWAEARRIGLLIEQPNSPVTLPERERSLLLAISTFVSTFYRPLLRPLKLQATNVSPA